MKRQANGDVPWAIQKRDERLWAWLDCNRAIWAARRASESYAASAARFELSVRTGFSHVQQADLEREAITGASTDVILDERHPRRR
ncbi:hypothetical protein GCM10011494_36760 [Novosphingobium endophyticum]|uniref:Uncharacterized protein n=1 Tax=Novosphingobium endophyticum TaxID=1955250 RepID=A0A916TVB1_9SPHN|nr:hypothetical protein [Novosphingobium endophyticum]GGC14584.1 hypothetical protein GCM10011494_36760 [Novosphingobium endophyticum]